MRIRRALIVLSLVLAAASPTVDAGRGGKSVPPAPEPPPPPGVSVETAPGSTRWRVVVPGRFVAYALPRSGGGRREVVVLVAPSAPSAAGQLQTAGGEEDDETTDEARPKRLPPCPSDLAPEGLALFRVIPTEPARLELVRDGLPHDGSALEAADLDADGRDELLLGRPGEVLAIAGSRVETLVREPTLTWRSVHPEATRHRELDGLPYVLAKPFGKLQLYGPGPERVWTLISSVDVPIRGAVADRGLRISSPLPRFVGRDPDGDLAFAAWPQAFGDQRLRTILAKLSLSGAPELVEAWARLPAPEEVLDRRFLLIDGRAMLLVATKPAKKLNLFGEKRLRLFPLEPDRSRLGHPPAWQAESRMNIWQEAHPLLLDIDGDGRDDLIVGYWKGIKDDRVVLDVYRRDPDGWFETSPRSTGFDVEDADRSMLLYGDDLNGDGLAELLVRSRDRLLIYPGLASNDASDLVAGKPLELPEISLRDSVGELNLQVRSGGDFEAWTTSGVGQPRLADVDGDGSREILLVVPRQPLALDELHVIHIHE